MFIGWQKGGRPIQLCKKDCLRQAARYNHGVMVQCIILPVVQIYQYMDGYITYNLHVAVSSCAKPPGSISFEFQASFILTDCNAAGFQLFELPIPSNFQ